MADPATIDGYLAALAPDQRAALQALREVIRAAAPEAEECISYKMPAFKLNGMLVGFAAHARHCAVYGWNGPAIAEFAGDLAGFEISKGAIRFTPEQPLPPSWSAAWSRPRSPGTPNEPGRAAPSLDPPPSEEDQKRKRAIPFTGSPFSCRGHALRRRGRPRALRDSHSREFVSAIAPDRGSPTSAISGSACDAAKLWRSGHM